MGERRQTRFASWLIEGFVIVGSILLAFGIDAAWESREERQLELAMAVAVAEEVRLNQRGLVSARVATQEAISRIDRFLALDVSAVDEMQPEDVAELVRLSEAATHQPLLSAATTLLQVTASDPGGLAIRDKVGQWVQNLSDLEVERLDLKQRQDLLQGELAPYASRYPEGGVAPTDLMLMRSADPGLVRELRADNDVVGAVVGLGHQQWNYEVLLGRSLALSDSVAQALEAFTADYR